jgi:hypothetical protein
LISKFRLFIAFSTSESVHSSSHGGYLSATLIMNHVSRNQAPDNVHRAVWDTMPGLQSCAPLRSLICLKSRHGEDIQQWQRRRHAGAAIADPCDREFDPRVFQVFGPKIVATRGGYDDAALESRFITEQTGGRDLREDIPINLPSKYEAEALSLRNKLLMCRFRNWGKNKPTNELVDRSIEPRLNQILAPLLSIVENDDDRDDLREFARACNKSHQKDIRLPTAGVSSG